METNLEKSPAISNRHQPPLNVHLNVHTKVHIHIWESPQNPAILNFGHPPSEKNKSLKHLELPKNHFKTNFFLCN